MSDHAAELGVDAGRIGVIGDSADGTLATAICLKARDHDGPLLICQIMIHPPTQWDDVTPSMIDNAEGILLETAGLRWFAQQYLRTAAEAGDPYAAP